MTPSTPYTDPVVTDLTVCFFSPTLSPLACTPDPRKWHRIEKELHPHTSQRKAWLYVALTNEERLTAEDLVVTDIKVGEPPPNPSSGRSWESRPGGIWVLRKKYSGDTVRTATEVDVLFGPDAVDPRPRWTLMRSSLELDDQPGVPVARLSVLYDRAGPVSVARPTLRIGEDGKFKIVQISDAHMIAGVGICKDAIDATGKHLPESEADPHTTKLIGEILDAERPDLVILTGDQVHHDAFDSQTALFKVVAPIVERSLPFAAVFGNHDGEGAHASSRAAQMSILRSLPFSLCEPGPDEVDGVGNFCLNVLAPAPSQLALSTLYFLDSHGQIPSKKQNPDYATITQSQIDWFTRSCQAQRSVLERDHDASHRYLSLVFQHIPLPEFRDRRLSIRSGHRGEPPECPSVNSRFYNSLVEQCISAFGCGHDHANDFCALLPRTRQDGDNHTLPGPWLCYGGACGFGGYGAYGTKRFHRRARVWQLDTSTGSLKTWKRIEYARDRVDELMLVEDGAVVDDPGEEQPSRDCVLN